MSDWTYLNGSVILNVPAMKEYNVPYNMKKQLSKDRNSSYKHAVAIHGLPIWKSTIEKLIKKLPKGEYNKIPHILSETATSDTSFNTTEGVLNKYVKENIYPEDDSNRFWFEVYDQISLSFNAPIRWYSAKEILKSLQEFFKGLHGLNIEPSTGYLEWIDSMAGERYAVRFDQYGPTTYMKLDRATNAILASKTIFYRWNKEQRVCEPVVEIFGDWKED